MFGLKHGADTREHTESYYAASATKKADSPTLEGEVEADVVIVGGGFSGVNTALELVEKGFDVVLLEANRIGWGATGRNGGQVSCGIGHKVEKFEGKIGKEGVRALYDMGFESVEILRERIAKYSIDCDLKWGYCDVAIKPRHMKWFEEWKSWEKSIGNPHEHRILDARQLKQYVGSDKYLGGMYNPTGSGHLHPLNLCTGEASAAVANGVRIFEQSRVEEIKHGQPVSVLTETGSVKAKYLVLCGNAYMKNLVPQLASKILPSNSSVIATEPLSADLAKQIMPSDVAVCDPRTALDYFRLSADNRMLFGGLSNYAGLEPSNLVGTMRKKMVSVFPELESVAIEYGWSGQMGIGINRMPQLGRLADNILYIQAYSGHGVAPTHLIGRVIAEAIEGNPERFDVFARIGHWSFPGGKIFRRPGLAIGMMYYKLLDEL